MGCPPPERLRSPEVLVKTAVQHSTAPTPPAHTAYTVLLSGAEPQVLPNNPPHAKNAFNPASREAQPTLLAYLLQQS